MPPYEIAFGRTLEEDATPLDEAVRRGLERPLVLWGHPEIGQSALVESAAESAGLPFRVFDAELFEGWDGFRDVSDSGHFREVSLERFLARGERADPNTFTVEANAVLYLRGLNRTPTRIVEAVFDQILDQGKLLNNPLPDGVRIVATAFPIDRESAADLLGPGLGALWGSLADRSPLQYTTFTLPQRLARDCEHWALLPSVRRFVAWGRRRGLAEEVLRFLEEDADRDPVLATAKLHAGLLRRPDPFPQTASPRAFADLGSLLRERRLYFTSRAVKDALWTSADAPSFLRWLHLIMRDWDPEQWIDADSSLTLRGEPVPGSVWLRNLIEQVRKGEVQVSLEDLPTYAAFERRSLAMWATQELGDEIGKQFVVQTAVTEADVARLPR